MLALSIAINVVLLISLILVTAALTQRINHLQATLDDEPLVPPPIIDNVPPMGNRTQPDDPLATWKS